MWFKKLLTFTFCLFIFCSCGGGPRVGVGVGVQVAQIQADIEDMRGEISSLSIEMEILSDRLNDESASISSLQNSINSKKSLSVTEEKRLEKDLAELQKHANDTTAAIQSYHNKILSLEKELNRLRGNVTHSKEAIKSLASTLGGSSEDSGKTYKVKSGDSLEKIARESGTSISKIRELNDLKGDLIVIGQKLRLP